MRRLSGITAGTLCAVLAAVGCDALSIGLTSDPDYMLKGPQHDWLQAAGGGPPNPACEADPTQDASTVTDECAVFVSATAEPGGDGTKAKPYASLVEAVANAGNKRVLACVSGAFAESVRIEAAVEVIGGFDCDAGWAWSEDARSAIEGPADEVALTLSEAASGAKVTSFAIRAASATEPGGSSIAVLVDGATAELARCELVAGNGAEGAEGEDAPSEAPAQASPGNAGTNACSDVDGTPGPDTTLSGGAQVVNECSGGLSIGGGGGDGNVLNGTGGDIGTPVSAGNGSGGLGESDDGWNCNVGGTNGGAGVGDNGARGDVGVAASGLGTLGSLGYVGVSGGAGGAGKPGQGGGGGGGAKGGTAICPGAMPGAGASGGSGGPGGCGGLPGQGGGAGGASIALASVDGKVTLKDCVLKAGEGGKGGAGGDLQPGGLGGVGGTGGTGVGGSKAACDGGKGGQGGNGGPGGGGLGGPSLAIAYRGEAVKQEGQTMLQPGTPGAGGPGGSNDVLENAGAAGTAAAEQEFP
ncbi:hypothetical protein WMF45_03535 [Sorangium sp. So ce448]|uniref:hypothetical protein n=1 Tax=Sorangium sp. So ce448 TaxID=3133314 RepID=UPI003F5FE38F